MEEMKFEEALKRLEDIVEKLESGSLELEESIQLFEQGVKLSLYCQQQLKQAEGRVQRLVKNLNGEFELLDL
ncbi:MAG: exodeoxyribonuclease VII small subunit [Syntrophomonadaceae bacterium]|nr:exodeoxyribonuclease VII small subunit [Syntrophomonadaceae bacterium]MDD3272115.1 exodeoxyribonuclease VII small subunit [Syntrophomonadaceae bacterium]